MTGKFNAFTAYNQRDRLNLKMLNMLRESLQADLSDILRLSQDYDEQRMAQYGLPFIKLCQDKLDEVEKLVAAKDSG